MCPHTPFKTTSCHLVCVCVCVVNKFASADFHLAHVQCMLCMNLYTFLCLYLRVCMCAYVRACVCVQRAPAAERMS